MRKPQLGHNSLVHKQFTITREPATGRVTVSTPGLDRHKDRVHIGQFDIGQYRRNPVLLWGHNYADPYAVIGRANEIEQTGTALSLVPQWRDIANDADPMNIIKLLWDTEMVRAFSIGFRPEEWTENTEGGLDYTAGEILEVSLVPVGANADALRAMAKGIGPAWLFEDMPPQFKPWGAAFGPGTANLTDAERKQAFLDALLSNTAGQHTHGLTIDSDTATYGPQSTTSDDPFVWHTWPAWPANSPNLVLREMEADTEPPMAWVRRLTVETNLGRHTCLASFYGYEVHVPEDALTLDLNEDGDIVEVPHPDAGKTYSRREVAFVPPVPFHNEKWGWDDAVYSISAKATTDEALVDEDDWEVIDLSPVLLALPRGPEPEKAFGHEVGRLCVSGMTALGQKLARRIRGPTVGPVRRLQVEELDAPHVDGTGRDELERAFATLTQELADWFRPTGRNAPQGDE